MLVDDALFDLAGSQIGVADEQGEPERVSIPADIDAFTNELWTSLDENNKISLFVRYTDLATRETEQRIINKHC